MTRSADLQRRIDDGSALRAVRNTSRHGDGCVNVYFRYRGQIGLGPNDKPRDLREVWEDWVTIPHYSSGEVTCHYWYSIEEVIAWIDANQENTSKS